MQHLSKRLPNQTNDDNNIISGEDSDDNESNYSEDTNCTVNNSSVHSFSSNSDSEYNVNVNIGNDNPRNWYMLHDKNRQRFSRLLRNTNFCFSCCHFKAFCGTASQG